MSVKGTVVRVSNIKPMCTVLAFECNNCATVQASKNDAGQGKVNYLNGEGSGLLVKLSDWGTGMSFEHHWHWFVSWSMVH